LSNEPYSGSMMSRRQINVYLSFYWRLFKGYIYKEQPCGE